MSEAKVLEQQSREILVVSTKTGEPTPYTSNASTWGELRSFLQEQGVNLSNLVAAENETNRDLSSPEAVLPTGKFALFLRPVQTKSGASFSEMRAMLKDNEDLKNFCNQYVPGKNYTQLTTAQLTEAIAAYNNSNGGTVVVQGEDSSVAALRTTVQNCIDTLGAHVGNVPDVYAESLNGLIECHESFLNASSPEELARQQEYTDVMNQYKNFVDSL